MTTQASSPPLFIYHHTHWDREWYQPFREYQIRLAEVGDAILDRLETKTFSCFTLDGQTIVLDDYLELRPWNREKLQRWIQSGTLNIGPWYVMPDEFLVSGESLVRNLQKGIQAARAWGCNEFTGYLPDTFGHSGDMPMIFNQFGILTAILWRGANPPGPLFQWRSRNQAEVLTYHLNQGYFQNFLHDPTLSPTAQQTALQGLVEKLQAASPNLPVLLPVGGDHLGPITAAATQQLHQDFPHLQEITSARFLANVRAESPHQATTTLEGELIDNTETFILPGVYSARLYLKQANRRLEHRLVACTEPLIAMAQGFLSHPPFYPVEELKLAWTLLLQNHPHDSICGCSVDAVHRENEVRFASVDQITDALSRRQRHALNRGLFGHAGPEAWVLYNLGDQPYTGIVPVREWGPSLPPAPTSPLFQTETLQTVLIDDYLYDLQDVPMADRTMMERRGWVWVEGLPAHGMQSVQKASCTGSEAFEPVTVQEHPGQHPTLENSLLSVGIQQDGSLWAHDLTTNQVYKGLHQLWDRAEQGDSYNSAPVPGTTVQTALLKGVTVLEHGPLRGKLCLTYHLPGLEMPMTTHVILEAGSKRLTFETAFTNNTPDHKLQVLFPTGAPLQTLQAEGHFGVETRSYIPAYHEDQQMPVASQKELKTNTGPLQRFVLANGQLLLTEGLTEYEVYGEKLAITLLRAFGFLSKGDTGVRGAQAGPPLPTSEGQCLGRPMVCRYGWMPQPPTLSDAYDEANRFYGVVFGEQGRGDGGASAIENPSVSLLQWENPHVVSTALYWSQERPGIVLRLLNTTADPQSVSLHAGFAYQALHRVNFLEETQGVLTSPDLVLAPYAVQTLFFQVQ